MFQDDTTPFHCVICFDEFSSNEQFPVVLPCGHTYVCNICAKRLKRCMECREPLFIMAPPKVPPINNLDFPLIRYHHGNAPSKRDFFWLPLPKNIVLMDMIEAKDKQKTNKLSLRKTNDRTSAALTVEEKDISDLNRIASSMAAISSPCGTYAVREPKGLELIPFHPQRLTDQNEYAKLKRKPFKTMQDQTVQLVDFHDGVAKLAQNAGYIVSNRSLLVKVGGPKDRTCKLEGIVDTMVSTRGKNLKLALVENRQAEHCLRKEIDLERTKEPDYPIITDAEPETNHHNFKNKIQHRSPKGLQNAQLDLLPSLQSLYLPSFSSEEVHTIEVNDSTLELAAENTKKENRRPVAPAAVSTNAFVYPKSNKGDMNSFVYECGTKLFGGSFLNFDQGGTECDQLEEAGLPVYTNSVEEKTQQQKSMDTAATRDMKHNRVIPTRSCVYQRKYNRSLVSQQTMTSISPDTEIDFRTGMSGHRALSKACKNTFPIPFSRSHRPMMSQHQGLGTALGPNINNALRHSSSFSPAPRPHLPSPPDYDGWW